jgi:hypothetical protein
MCSYAFICVHVVCRASSSVPLTRMALCMASVGSVLGTVMFA